MDADYASGYAELYRSHWWWRAREALVTQKIAQLVPAEGWRRALDIGCGDGLFLPQLSRFAETVEGLEVEGRLVSEDAARRYSIHIGALDERFAPAAPYEFISMLDVLEHIAQPLPALRRCREIMAPQGILVLTVPAFRALWTSHDELNRHYARYTRRELIRLVNEAGFDAIESRYFFHWLVLPKWVVRQAERVLGPHVHHPGIPPHFVNRVLHAFSRIERRIFKPLGWMPGTSIFLAATPQDQT
jgi:SAM-dependent methyltransferase